MRRDRSAEVALQDMCEPFPVLDWKRLGQAELLAQASQIVRPRERTKEELRRITW